MEFLEKLRESPLDELAEYSANVSSSEVEKILSKRCAETLEEFAALISPKAEKYLENMAQISAETTFKYFGRTMRLFAPLYLSNDCVNNCLYCGFARRHSIERRTLSLDEVSREIEAIYNLGFRNVLLVASENPKLVSSGYVKSCVELAAKKFPSVSVEIAPSKVSDYVEYANVGCEGLTVFQETYSENVYPSLHPSGPKADFKWRLATPERGAEAGMRKIGLGALLGVNKWRFEILAMALHAKFLTRKFWKTQVSVSLPRMRPAEGGYVPLSENIPNDRQIVQIVCAFRMFLNRLSIVVSTRESSKLRDGLMGLGVTQMSAFSSTRPGGYAEREESGEQFSIDDSRTPEEFSKALKKRGIDPVWKDFDFSIRANFK